LKSVRAVALAFGLATLTALACSGPQAPMIPPRDVVGPPYEASRDCTPPTDKFAKPDPTAAGTNFLFADFDDAKSCIDYIEQDECILAIYRDCTFTGGSGMRSWVGAIAHDKTITLSPTFTNSGVPPHQPAQCSGSLNNPVSGAPAFASAPWALLSCPTTKTGEAPYQGIYFERADSTVTAALHLASGVINVAAASGPRMNFLSDMIILSSMGQLWAIANTGMSGDARNGLYVGPTMGTMLSKQGLALTLPGMLRAASDDSVVLIVDGHRITKVDPHSPGTAAATYQAPSDILDVGIRGRDVLVAFADPLPGKSDLLLLTLDALAPEGTMMQVQQTISRIVPSPTTSTTSIALLLYSDRQQIDYVGNGPAIFKTVPINFTPAAFVLLESGAFGLSASGPPGHYYELDHRGAPVFDVIVPDSGQVDAIVYDDKNDLVITSAGSRVAVIDRAERRPLLASFIRMPDNSSVTRLVRDSGSKAIYALDAAGGVIYRLDP
jgi:hypothetical protein